MRRLATVDIDNRIVVVVNSIARVREFNRFYTRLVGALDGQLVGTRFSLVEARLLYEIAQAGPDGAGVGELRRRLRLDGGYLSRLLARLDGDGLLHRRPDPADARRQVVSLTDSGRHTFSDLNRRQEDTVGGLLAPLPADRRADLTSAMDVITDVLEPGAATRAVVLRGLEPGDLGWVVSRHGSLYAHEYGWDTSFEAMTAEIVAEFGRHHDPARETGWIAEVDGRPVGSVFCVDSGDGVTAKLRLLLVEPSARGLGVGGRLVEECLRFARRAGYRRITLWTNGALDAARRIYQRAGFVLDDETTGEAFGGAQVTQNWSRDL